MKVAVIGSGIAGLAACRMLVDLCDVTLFERMPAIGIDAHSINLKPFDSASNAAYQPARVDVPSRMFNPAEWPNLWQLYNEIGVEIDEVDASQSVGDHSGNVWLNLPRANRIAFLSSTMVNLLDSTSRRLLMQARQLREQGLADLQAGISPETTFGVYLQSKGLAGELRDRLLYPTLTSTVFTCSYACLDNYPAYQVLATLKNLGENDGRLYRSRFGTRDVAEKLVAPAVDMKLGAAVEQVEDCDDEVRVSIGDQTHRFDHVILATQANTALKLLAKAQPEEDATLKGFEYESVRVRVHADSRLMPQKKKHWSTFNMITNPELDAAACTVWLNRFHANWDDNQPDIFQTIGPLGRVNEDLVISEAELQRPVVTCSSNESWNRLDVLHEQPRRRVWFCGSYAGRGTPLLESGVVSAKNVVSQLKEILVANTT